jgi:glycyl-tRNA synthetase
LTESKLDFQSIIFNLQHYWVDWGCTLWQPYYSQVGAGTMNPATFLRVLGPEPWNVAYVEPSVRPDDGRYGENPNRLQQHYQFQVILKPDPGNPQEAYLRSLEAIGIDVHKHDIRFVEDNWTSPALGAWGLGWEVWLDGLEISQFTYFQQAGGMTLDPVSVEITYGLDRIAMALQGVANVGEIQWSETRSWGDLNLQGEREHSRYYFELADVERLRQMYDLYEAEAQAALEAGLILPAHDYVLKCSHTFNILDTRGAVGVTERQSFFRRMRKLSSQVAEAYVEDRKKEEFPWMDEGAGESKASGKGKPGKISGPKEAADFLLEIGTEELPPGDLNTLLGQIETAMPELLKSLRLDYAEVQVQGSPRRLTALVVGLEAKQPDRDEVVKGPPASRAFDEDGKATKAGEGFARGQGVDVADLKVEEIDGGDYVVVRVSEKGRLAAEVLAESLADFVAALKVDRTMRWNASGRAFSRPIRWLLAMHGEHSVPFGYAGLQSQAQSRGLSLAEDEVFDVKSPTEYFAQLKSRGILLDVDERRVEIQKQIDVLAKKAGGAVPEDAALLDEVTHLVEAPKALLGSFAEEFLELPREVLIAVMRKHQRYFPIVKEGELTNAFVAVGNGDFDVKAVTAGNEDVIRARFADAAYFVERDRERPLESYVEDLKQLAFQADLGSMWDKTQRVTKLIGSLAESLGLSAAEQKTAKRAAELSKADLATQMVVEMTSLQGVIGRYYALDSGESEDVAGAIEEQYLPRYSGDGVPQSKAGLVLTLADRLDTLSGLFAVGLAPKGNKDPFALRRAAIGLIEALLQADQDFDLAKAISAAAKLLPLKMSAEAEAECLAFIVRRMRVHLLDEGHRHDAADAILTAQANNPAVVYREVTELGKHLGHKVWPEILDSYSRCVRITRDLETNYSVKEDLFVEQVEKDLFAALETAEAAERRKGSVKDFSMSFLPMRAAISAFFDGVMVMDEDERLRQNRLGMLQRIVALADGVADFSKMEGF